jgi:hypothetical protein
MRRVIVVVLVLCVVALLGGLWWLQREAEPHALLHLPTEQRRQVYNDALAEFHRLCWVADRPPASEFTERCREQVKFLLQFPECDAECQSLANRFTQVTPHPR